MRTIDKAYITWSLCGYLATTLILAIVLQLEGMALGERFGLFTIGLAVPFALSLFIVARLFETEFKLVKTPLQAIRGSICGGALLVALVAFFTSVGGLIYSSMGEGAGEMSLGTAIMALLTITFAALIYAAIPILIFGTVLGLRVYANSKVSLESEAKL